MSLVIVRSQLLLNKFSSITSLPAMCRLFSLPLNFLVPLVSEWLELIAVGELDSALTLVIFRVKYLQLISHDAVIFRGILLFSPEFTSNFAINQTSFENWAVLRKVKVDSYHIRAKNISDLQDFIVLYLPERLKNLAKHVHIHKCQRDGHKYLPLNYTALSILNEQFPKMKLIHLNHCTSSILMNRNIHGPKPVKYEQLQEIYVDNCIQIMPVLLNLTAHPETKINKIHFESFDCCSSNVKLFTQFTTQNQGLTDVTLKDLDEFRNDSLITLLRNSPKLTKFEFHHHENSRDLSSDAYSYLFKQSTQLTHITLHNCIALSSKCLAKIRCVNLLEFHAINCINVGKEFCRKLITHCLHLHTLEVDFTKNRQSEVSIETVLWITQHAHSLTDMVMTIEPDCYYQKPQAIMTTTSTAAADNNTFTAASENTADDIETTTTGTTTAEMSRILSLSACTTHLAWFDSFGHKYNFCRIYHHHHK